MKIIEGPATINFINFSDVKVAEGEFAVLDAAGPSIKVITQNRLVAQAVVEASTEHGLCCSCHERAADHDMGYCNRCLEETQQRMREDDEMLDLVTNCYATEIDIQELEEDNDLTSHDGYWQSVGV